MLLNKIEEFGPRRVCAERLLMPKHKQAPPRPRERHIEAAAVSDESQTAFSIGAHRREDNDVFLAPLEAVDGLHLEGSRSDARDGTAAQVEAGASARASGL